MRKLLNAARVFGIDIERTLNSARGIPQFIRDYRRFKSECDSSDEKPTLRHVKPILSDRFASAGSVSDYFLQDLWAARKIYAARPAHHLDVGSRIDGFISALLTFMDVEVVDVRPLKSSVAGLIFTQGDGTNLANIASDSLQSVSSLHAVEHFGLGRYGDPIDPKASLKAMAELQRILAPGGSLYFSVPVGKDRVEFNAHRVFSPATILQQFAGLKLASFGLIDDLVQFHERTTEKHAASQRFGIGLFHFEKPTPQS